MWILGYRWIVEDSFLILLVNSSYELLNRRKYQKNDYIKNNINDEDENEVLQDMSNIKDKWNLFMIYVILNLVMMN